MFEFFRKYLEEAIAVFLAEDISFYIAESLMPWQGRKTVNSKLNNINTIRCKTLHNYKARYWSGF